MDSINAHVLATPTHGYRGAPKVTNTLKFTVENEISV